MEGVSQLASVALPQEGASGEAPGLDQGELLVTDAVEALVVIWSPGSSVGGEAVGLDRLTAVLAGEENIREVIAFPKTQSGADPLTGAPTPIDDRHLAELGLGVVPPPG